jgi:anti-sigma regulatory factor (Ser/Thr protein kinase)
VSTLFTGNGRSTPAARAAGGDRYTIIGVGDDVAVSSISAPPPDVLVLPQDLAAVSTARRFVKSHCQAMGYNEDTCDTAVLLTSETVTNAFIHGRSEARIRVDPRPGRLLVEVADDNSRHPRPAGQDDDALDGRGLAIVGLLADRWGVVDDAYGKTVWFELATG